MFSTVELGLGNQSRDSRDPRSEDHSNNMLSCPFIHNNCFFFLALTILFTDKYAVQNHISLKYLKINVVYHTDITQI